jgi:hypothetical protein
MSMSWHQQRAAGMHGLPDDVVGYTYNADLYCHDCIIAALPIGEGQAFDGWALAPSIDMDTESHLSEIAAAFGIDRGDEASFDSGDFPKVLFRDMLSEEPELVFDPEEWSPDRCGSCGEMLGE